MPRAIVLVRDGALIGAPPFLWYCRDTDGDGRADEKIEIANDFGFAIDPNNVAIGEPENKPNNPLWSYDNWIYVGHYPARFRWRDGKWDRALATSLGQWGLSQDDWGHFFNNSNSAQLSAQMIPAHYLSRNPNYPRPRGRSVTVARDQSVWPVRVSPGINRGYVPEMLRDNKLKEFTSACAPWIYRADLFPADFYGNAFVCEPAGNLIKRDFVSSEGGNLSAREAYHEREFIASTDERFRPVNLTTGPDGALYVCDMYHGIIQHRVSVSKYLEDQVKARGLDKPTGLGRIWRVVPSDAKRPAPPRLAQETPARWVAHLSDGNAWWRETAQRLLVERGDVSVVPALEAVAKEGKSPMGRVHALCTLEGLQRLTWDPMPTALRDADPRVRAAGVRLAEQFFAGSTRKEAMAQLASLADREESPEVQLQLALSLGQAGDPAADKAMVKLFQRAPEHPWLRDAILTGLGGRELETLQAAATGVPDKAVDPLLGALAGCVIGERKPERIERLFELIAKLAPERQAAILSGVPTNVLATPKRAVKLDAEPKGLARLRAEAGTSASRKKLVERATAVLTWPGKPGAAAEVEVTPLTAEEQARFNKGQMLFVATCASCHQPHGLGLEGLAPPLADSEWVTGPVERLARIAINGVRGPIQVGNARYALDMPAWGALDDDSLAAIFTYIRREWGHAAAPVDPATVARIRADVADRHDAWTQPELLKIPAR
jgi:mono/diheme cytochrome c family protein